MLQQLVFGFLDALSALTLLRLAPKEPSNGTRRAFALACYPLIGLLFGLIGFALAALLYPHLTYLAAWLIPVSWLLLAGGGHFVGLCRFTNAALAQGSPERRRELLAQERIQMAGTAIGVVFFTGKFFALLQTEILDPKVTGLLLLLTPILSRYTAVLLTVAADGFDRSEHEPLEKQPHILIGSSLLLLGIAFVSPALALTLCSTALLCGVIVRACAMRLFSTVPQSAMGAVIELSELVLLWVPSVCMAAGTNIAMLRLF